MPAYSFKERFVPFVEDGTKPHTMRSRRKNFAKPGDPLYLYYGMRTRFCKKLREGTCAKTISVLITKDEMYVFNGLLLEQKQVIDVVQAVGHVRFLRYTFSGINSETLAPVRLTKPQRDRFAWLDGFRPAGTSLKNPMGCFQYMLSYWKESADLPWCGDIIYWSLEFEQP